MGDKNPKKREKKKEKKENNINQDINKNTKIDENKKKSDETNK